MNNKINELINLNTIPKDFGVYLWKDEYNKVLYVGKSKNLHNRIKQYLNGSLNSYKTSTMLEKAKKVEYIICSNEKESLILEQELIKKYKPYYNILLLDDKKYPYIVVELKKQGLEITTKYLVKDKPFSFYYGPLPTGYGFKVLKNFLIRECLFENGLPIKNNNYSFWMKKFEYTKKILSSSNKEFVNKLKKQMMNASENQQFELAAELRDVINYLSNRNQQNQSITNFNINDFDVIGFVHLNNYLLVGIHHFRNGTFFVQEEFIFEIKINLENTIIQFINQFYAIRIKPKLIITNYEINKNELIIEINIKKPQKGKFLNALINVIKNIESNKEQKVLSYQKKISDLKQIKVFLQNLSMSKKISEIMIIDNSNLKNTNIVSVISYFKNFQPDFSKYRKYTISDNEIQRLSDVEYIFQGLSKYFSNKENSIPNILIVDGGKQQINEAKKVLKKFEINIPVLGLVKNQNHETRAIIDINLKEHIINDANIYNFFANIQTEVDSYAKRFHTKKMIQNSLEGSLLKISGIGPKIENKLISHFKTYSNIYNAPYEELIKIVSPSIAKKILNKI